MGRHDSSSEEDGRVRRSDRERGRRGSTRVTADKPTSDDRQKSRRESERKRRDNEGLLKRDRRERDWSDSQRDKLRKEEKSEVTKPKLPELNPSDSNAKALGKTGGVYIPPFKLARMMKEVEDKSSVEYQRLTWDALRYSINGLVNKELSEYLGIRLLNERLQDPTMQESLESIFPKDNPKNTRFAINFFTSIGLGGITESLREYLKNMPRLIMQQQKQVAESESGSDSSGSESDSDSDSSSASSSSDESDRETRKRKRRRRRS
ncbi:hypothetical protein F2Q70_00044362 [Brassica cretica]|uniref:Uncharacterized protein n=1 Tax=Brassica cretica TaxID=69181 RepID=A0A8S9KF00_BRACR|nr:hypothetical protein F2Q70_00044362 [Brassica cretica]